MTAEIWQGVEVAERRLPVPGGELNVVLAGDGPALVLLHGITSSAVAWSRVAAPLARHYRLIALDQRGHGRSFKPERGYLLADYARDLDAVLAHFELERPLIMGHSLGGMVTLEWAITHPEQAAALVIEDSPMRHGGEGSGEMFDEWMARSILPAPAAEAYYRVRYPQMDDDEVRRRAESITSTAMGVFTELKAEMLAHKGASVIHRYTGITSPVQLVYGDLSEGGMVPLSDARQFEASLPNGETARISGVGHSVHFDAPDRFIESVLPFLQRHAPHASFVAAEAV